MLVAIAAAILVINGEEIWMTTRLHKLVEAPAFVEDADWSSTLSSSVRSPNAKVLVTTRYEVDGKTYTSERFTLGMNSLYSPTARRIVREFRDDPNTTVWYDPEKPSLATIRKDAHAAWALNSFWAIAIVVLTAAAARRAFAIPQTARAAASLRRVIAEQKAELDAMPLPADEVHARAERRARGG